MDYSVHEIKTYLNFVGSAIREKSFLVLKEDPDGPTCTRAKNSDFMRIYVKHDFDPSGRIKDLIVSLHKLELPILRAFES